MPDDLKLFVDAFRKRIQEAGRVSYRPDDFPITPAGISETICSAIDGAWAEVDQAHERRYEDWLRERFGDKLADQLIASRKGASHG